MQTRIVVEWIDRYQEPPPGGEYHPIDDALFENEIVTDLQEAYRLAETKFSEYDPDRQVFGPYARVYEQEKGEHDPEWSDWEIVARHILDSKTDGKFDWIVENE